MLVIGSYNDLVVEREVDFGFYLNPKEDEVLLPLKYAPDDLTPGDTLRVFVYTDSEDRPVATTLTPTAVVGDFAYLMVRDVTPIGAFLDWGLEKDLLVPKSEQQDTMKKGEHYLVKVCLDEYTDRVYATTRIAENCEGDVEDLVTGQLVELKIYKFTKLGIMAVIDNLYHGMLHRDETYESISIGDIIEGYISRIRPDGKIDLSLKKPGYRSLPDSARTILTALEHSGGFIPCHDKSSPEEIKEIFSMSKKEFKRTIGNLYKKGEIIINSTGIRRVS